MKRLVFSGSARRDRDAIIDYTIKQFGLEQAVRLREAFALALGKLQSMPNAGRLRPDLSPAGRALRSVVIHGSFVAVYEVADNAVRVARILHAARDLPSVLLDDAGDE